MTGWSVNINDTCLDWVTALLESNIWSLVNEYMRAIFIGK